MVMTKVFDKLKDLQEILVHKYDLEKKVREAPKQLTSQEELLDRMKKEFIGKNTDYEEARAKVAQLQSELDEAVKSRESGEKGMDNITTHREYEALDRQISEASLKEQDIRKDLQKEEKTLADLNDNLKQVEAMIKSQEADLNAGRASLDKELNSYKSELAALEKKENKITPDLDQEILFKFERIIQRNTQGIVAVKNGVCQGCCMFLPAQFANEVRKNEEILFCPYCSRILYYEETSEDQKQSFTGSLANLDDDDEFEDEFEDEDEENEEKEAVGDDDEIFDDEDDIDDDENEDDDIDDEDDDQS